jgi:hypothetical protein
MHIVAIAWLYVTILMAATEPSLVGALLTFVLYGLGPLALFLYIFGRHKRSVGMPVRELADDPHARDPEKNE